MQQSEICCVCIRTNLELIRITETDPNTIKYSCKLNQCVPEVVWNEENHICEQCIEQLEGACAFRELCLQSHTIRQQLAERNLKEEITIEDENIIKVEDPILILNEPEFANVKALPLEEIENPNKSYLRDLLETPQEILKAKNYTIDKNYAQYMKEKVKIPRNLFPNDPLESVSDEDDDIMFVETKDNDLNVSELQDYLLEKIQIEPQEETNENTDEEQEKTDEEQEDTNEIQEKPNEEESTQTKDYNLNEDGVEFVEETSFCKSLLRDLLLKPQEKQKTSYNSVVSHNEEETNEKSYFDNRIKRLPDPPHTEDYHQCKHCAIKFKDRRNLTKHNKDLHQYDRPWDCIYCNKSFKTEPELKQHEKSHQNQRKYECSVCFRSYNTTSVLAKHKIIKHKSPNDWRYFCPHCDQKYPFKAYRDQHIRRNHTNAGNEYICFHCNTGFSSKLLLIAHIRYKHNADNPMKQCHICQNTYINQTELDGHMLQRHNLETIKFPKKIKKYKCDKCSKLYTTLKAKNSHRDKCDGIRRHTSKKITEVKLEWTPS